jgi:hypothetical protein
MRFLLIAQEAHTLPYAIELTEETVEQALVSTADLEEGRNIFRPFMLIDMESGEVKRPVRTEQGWTLSDTAFTQNFGVDTPDEYFTEGAE